MKKIIVLFFLLSLFLPGYTQENKPVTGTIEFVSKKLSKLVNKDAKVEIIAEDFQFTEGPLWVEKEQMLLLSDVPGNTIYKWTEANGKEVYVKTWWLYGYSKKRRIYGSQWTCSFEGWKIDGVPARRQKNCNNGCTTQCAATKIYYSCRRLQWQKRLNSPNDLFLTAGGDLYFTDPSYGFERGARDPKKEIAYEGVYKMDNTGTVTLLVDSIEAPNGIAIFPNGKTLLVANSDSRKKRWYAYDIASNGSLAKGRVFYDVSNEKGAGGCDGLKIDSKGNVFATGPGGIWIFTKAGKLIGKIKINGTSVANCAFSADGKTIYLTATKYLLRVKMR